MIGCTKKGRSFPLNNICEVVLRRNFWLWLVIVKIIVMKYRGNDRGIKNELLFSVTFRLPNRAYSRYNYLLIKSEIINLGLSFPSYCSPLPEYLHCTLSNKQQHKKNSSLFVHRKSNGKLDNTSLQNNVTSKYILLGTTIRMTINLLTVKLSHLHHKRIQIHASRGPLLGECRTAPYPNSARHFLVSTSHYIYNVM